MRFLLLFACFVAVCYAASSTVDEWVSFKTKFGKRYSSINEENFRLGVYLSNKEMIEAHNERYRQGLETYEMKVNHFADKLEEEIDGQMNGLDFSELQQRSRPKMLYSAPVGEELPESVDWRVQGAVTPVKNQGTCGSCWAFSTTGAVEGQMFLKTGKLVSLSEQNLMDCSGAYRNNGCHGGLMTQAFQYIIDNGGIDSEDSYPYEASGGWCRFKERNVAATLSSYVEIPPGDEEALKSAVANIGPISVAMNGRAASLRYYNQGVYSDVACDQNLSHGVLLVGYGTEDGQDYWLIKNSWSSWWGEEGYAKIARNGNVCGITLMASYPVV